MTPLLISITGLGLIGTLAILLVMAAVRDVRHYLISNRLCLAVAALAPFYMITGAAADGVSLLSRSPEIYLLGTLAIAAVVFIVCCIFFAIGVMGGGDVKLITAVSLWTGPNWTLDFLLATAVAGGVVTLAMIAKTQINAQIFSKTSQFVKTHGSTMSPGPEMSGVQVPYGVAIAIGGLLAAFRMGSDILMSL